jgi:predicted phosphodiesterase
MSRILFFGDPHGDLAAVREVAIERRPAAVVLLGDVEPASPLDREMAAVLDIGIEVLWIPGNHDTDAGPEGWRRLADPALNPRTAGGNLHGRVAAVAGIRVAGLGGVFRGGVWRPPERPVAKRRSDLLNERQGASQGKHWKHVSSIFPEEYRALLRMRADVLVSHEAPSSHVHGWEEVDAAARGLRARMVVHGHHHENYASRARDGLLAVGVGRAAAVDETGALVDAGRDARPREPRLSSGLGWTRAR